MQSETHLAQGKNERELDSEDPDPWTVVEVFSRSSETYLIHMIVSKPKIAINSPVPTRISRIFWMINVVRNPTKNAPNAGFNSFFIVHFLFYESSLSDITVIHFDQIPLKLLIISLTQY